ncbi:hypothetical protein KCP75_11260 [Salmonella enterica subsp. enterica]|nr:hypothetical protein KCP75_11260 [Salmonella enterica subsp. enterica]
MRPEAVEEVMCAGPDNVFLLPSGADSHIKADGVLSLWSADLSVVG